MKRIITIAIVLLLTTSMLAQAPDKMSYQAVVRDASNNLIVDKAVGMQISILQNTATGTTVYAEKQTPTSNSNGLVSTEIGTGTVIDGDLINIDWSDGPYFIKTETDPKGGTDYTISGTSQILSVPYALHAKTAERIIGSIDYTETDPLFASSVANGITDSDIENWNTPTIDTDTHIDSIGIADLGYTAGAITTESDPLFASSAASGITASDIENWNNSAGNTNNSGHYVGELFGGGIVYYVYDNGAHGLIASLDDLDGGGGVPWSATQSTLIGPSSQSFHDGASNTAAIVAQDNTPGYAATLCANYTNESQSDWYLPSSSELSLMYNSVYIINQTLENDGDGATNGLDIEYIAPTHGRYWSSTEAYYNNGAWQYRLDNGISDIISKNTIRRVRAVRSF